VKPKESNYPVIIIDNNNMIIDGHHKYLAYKKLGIKNIPTVTESQLTDIWNKAQKDGVSLTSAEKADLEGTGKIDYRQPSAGEIRKALSSGAKKVINKPKKKCLYISQLWIKLKI